MQQGGAQSSGTPAELPVSWSVYWCLSALTGLWTPVWVLRAQPCPQDTSSGSERRAQRCCGMVQSQCRARQRPCGVMEALPRPGEDVRQGLEMSQLWIYSLMSSWYRIFYVGSPYEDAVIWCHYRTIKDVVFWLETSLFWIADLLIWIFFYLKDLRYSGCVLLYSPKMLWHYHYKFCTSFVSKPAPLHKWVHHITHTHTSNLPPAL